VATSYDQIPYRSAPFPQTRPDRLAAVAKLFGLDAPPADAARVLELGCGAGANLVGMAHDFPGGRFVGIDASARQIADGWAEVQALGLTNVELRHLDIAAAGDLGEFDYVVCHGVYSWVPPAVQERILEIVRRSLVRNGVGYVSYNTYPGWHVRGIVRDMMRYHGSQFPDAPTRLGQAKALVKFVAESGPPEGTKYTRLLQDEFAHLAAADESYLHHEHLEDVNQPVYFHEFAAKLGAHGLQYLGEAEFSTMVSTNFAPAVADTLRQLGAHDILQMEQYMDFVRCRYFRQTLVCNRAARLNRTLDGSVVTGLRLATAAAPVAADPDLTGTTAVEFQAPGGAGLTVRHPLTKAALTVLRDRWPAAVPFAEVEAAARGLCGSDETTDFLAGDLLAGMAAGVVEWRLASDQFVTTVAEKPEASALARHQAATGGSVTSRRGELLELDLIHRRLVRDADGTRTQAELVESLAAHLEVEGHVLRRDGDDTPVTDPAEVRQVLGPAVEKALRNLAGFALLVGPKG